jgi:PAS domain S-box-containing protein
MIQSEDFRRLEQIMRFSPDILCAIDSQGLLGAVNVAFGQVLGYSEASLVGKPFTTIIHPDDRLAALHLTWKGQAQDMALDFECRCVGQTGQEVVVAWSVFRAPADELLLCVGRNVTARRQAAHHDYCQEELFKVLVQYGLDMVGLVNEAGIYTYLGGSTQATLGYLPEQLLGRNAFDFIHPEDVPRVLACWEQLKFKSVVVVPDFRFRAASGEWKWVETCIRDQTQNPAIAAYVVSSRDITERRQVSSRLQEREQRFRLLFENNPSLAVFQDTDGAVVDINPAFLAFLNQPREAVIGQPMLAFMPVESRALLEEQFQKALSGQTVHIKASVRMEDGKDSILSVTKAPVVVEDKIIGVHVVAKDITENMVAQDMIKRQAEHLSTILESITDAFLSVDQQGTLTYANREAERLLTMRREDCLGQVLWDVFPYQLDAIYREQGEAALASGTTRHFEVFSRLLNRWLDVKMFPSPEGLAIYLSDVTERIETKRQLEMLSLVARSTDNSVIITDTQDRTIWVNDAFTRNTGFSAEDVMGKTPGEVLWGPETDPVTVAHIRNRPRNNKTLRINVLGYKKAGQKIWLAIDITPVYDEEGQLIQYISILQNITYRKEIEASQAKMTQDLYRHNRDLQQFAYVISHNLRAPLANSMGLASLLTKVDRNSPVFDTSLAHLHKSMGETDTVLQELNMVLSIRDQQEVAERQAIAVSEVCQQAILNLNDALQQCGGQVTLDIADDLVMYGNRAYLYSIFYNLLSNSIKYRSNERTLAVEIKSYVGEQGGTTISFTDNGSGFDMHKAGSDVFQLYKRFHTNQRGRGIGLFLVKTHVEAMGGKIEVTSGVNDGTRFLIHLDKA